MDATGLSARAKRRGLSQRPVRCWPGFGENIDYIYPELRIENYPSGSGKGAGLL